MAFSGRADLPGAQEGGQGLSERRTQDWQGPSFSVTCSPPQQGIRLLTCGVLAPWLPAWHCHVTESASPAAPSCLHSRVACSPPLPAGQMNTDESLLFSQCLLIFFARQTLVCSGDVGLYFPNWPQISQRCVVSGWEDGIAFFIWLSCSPASRREHLVDLGLRKDGASQERSLSSNITS